MDSTKTEKQVKIRGIPISPGIEIGRAVVVFPPSKGHIRRKSSKTVREELALFRYAKESIEKDFVKAGEMLVPSLVQLIESQLMIVKDRAFNEGVRSLIRKGNTAEFAIHRVLSKMAQEIEGKGTEYMKERAFEMRQLIDDMIQKLRGKGEVKLRLRKDTILLAEDMSIQEVIRGIRSGAKAVALGGGGRTSHAAIILKNSNIPAVFGLKEITGKANKGDEIALDGAKGVVILHPTLRTKSALKRAKAEFDRFTAELLKVKGEAAITQDGRQISLCANIDFPEELSVMKQYGDYGIGLFRTELLFYSNRTDEEAQEQMYMEMAQAIHPHPFVIRAFDVGGDKMMDVMERNPFLGMRGIRALLSEGKAFRTQLRAILKANRWGNIQVMIPMVSDVEEVKAAKNILLSVVEELRAQGFKNMRIPEFGVMIETPSSVFIAQNLAKYVDFMSIGTNDLTQYTLAADRRNPKLSYLFDHLHPSVLNLISRVVAVAKETETKLSVCGELASDPFGVPLLLALGIEHLSMNPSLILETKELIRRLTVTEVEPILKRALCAESAKEVRELVGKLIYSRFPDILRFLV
jgi:phosphotransferase system enzyme I (PtsI)